MPLFGSNPADRPQGLDEGWEGSKEAVDKYEKKVRVNQITSLAEKGEYADAMDIADTIDWRNEKSIRTLRMISEVYKVNKRYDDAYHVLSIAYEKDPDDPIKRKIVYDLCELTIRMNQLGYAVRYLKEFIKLSPDDSGRYVLQYKLLKATGASYEEQIELLEEFKKNYFGDFLEKWAYELAALYHRTGQSQMCINACDEIILWFVKGPYVVKARQLKMEYSGEADPLPQQNTEGSNSYAPREQGYYAGQQMPEGAGYDYDPDAQEEEYVPQGEEWYQQNGESYNDGSGQDGEYDPRAQYPGGEYYREEPYMQEGEYYARDGQAPRGGEYDAYGRFVPYGAQPRYEYDQSAGQGQPGTFQEMHQPMPIEVRQVQPSNQPTIRMPDKELQTQLAEEAKEPVPAVDEQMAFPEQHSEVSVNLDKFSTINLQNELKANMDELQRQTGEPLLEKEEKIPAEPDPGMTEIFVPEPEKETSASPAPSVQKEDTLKTLEKQNVSMHPKVNKAEDRSASFGNPAAAVQTLDPADPFKNITSEDYNGQIFLHVPDSPEELEKQITGQMDIETMMKQWDRIMEEGKQNRIIAAKEKSFRQTEDIVRQMEVENPGYRANVAMTETVFPENESRFQAISPKQTENQPSETEMPKRSRAEEEPVDREEPPEREEEQPKERKPVGRDTAPIIQAFAPAGSGDEQNEPGNETESIPNSGGKRNLTEEEEDVYRPFLEIAGMPEKLERAAAAISLNAAKGNIVITGSDTAVRTSLIQAVVKDQQQKHPELKNRVAEIAAEVFNSKDIQKSLRALNGAVLVIGHAGKLTDKTMKGMLENLTESDLSILVILEDTRNALRDYPERYELFSRVFDVRLDIPKFTNDDLVTHAQEYANEREYAIDDLGKLALYSRIDERQTADHIVTMEEVEDIVDAAIKHVDKKNPAHLMDVLLGKRYNKDDLIILREKDFVRK